MAEPITYSIDTSALIHGWHRAYRPRNFGFVWNRLDALITEGRIKLSIEALHELEKKEDDLFKWCKVRSNAFVVDITEDCQLKVIHIMGKYPRLVDTVKGRSAADPFVIALASTTSPAMMVISEEQSGKTRIPDVCNSEGIQCKFFADLIEIENWQFF